MFGSAIIAHQAMQSGGDHIFRVAMTGFWTAFGIFYFWFRWSERRHNQWDDQMYRRWFSAYKDALENSWPLMTLADRANGLNRVIGRGRETLASP